MRQSAKRPTPAQADLVAHFQKWDVERLAIEADEAGDRLQVLLESLQHPGFLGRVPQEVLVEAEDPLRERAYADEEDKRARASGQAGRLRVEERQPLQRYLSQGRLPGDLCHQPCVEVQQICKPTGTMRVLRWETVLQAVGGA